MAIVLALLSAAAYGTADYVGGIVAGKASPWQVAVIVMGSATLRVDTLALLVGGSPAGSDWLLSFAAAHIRRRRRLPLPRPRARGA